MAGSLVTSDDLGIEDPDVVPGGAVTFRIAKRHTIRVEAFGFSVDGSNRIDTTFTFDGNIYPIGTSVTSEADVLFAGAEYGYDLVHTELVALGLTLGVRYVSAKASIEAPLLDQEGEGEFQVPLPAVGLVIVLHPIPVPLFSSLALTAQLSGGTIGERGSFIDVDGGIEWLPIPILALRVGIPLLPRGRAGRRGRGQGRPERTLRERDPHVLRLAARRPCSQARPQPPRPHQPDLEASGCARRRVEGLVAPRPCF